MDLVWSKRRFLLVLSLMIFLTTLMIYTDNVSAANTATIYYKRGYTTPYIHYRPEGGSWTAAPGIVMKDSEYPGYSVATLDLGSVTRVEVCFNNGNGSWDSNGGANYFFIQGESTYDSGNITAGAPQINTVTIYYKRGYATPYIHYRLEGGTWTTAPGEAMEDSQYVGYSVATLNLGSATRAEVCFNDGNGNWDSNGGSNYFFDQGVSTYDAGTITIGAPVADYQAPSTPTNLVVSSTTSSSASLSWVASTDNIGVVGYEVYRNGIKVGTSANTTYTDSGLTPETTYSYTVKAYDGAMNVSYSSDSVDAITQAGSTVVKSHPMKLGAVYSPTETDFRIWSPDSSNVKVVVDGIEYTCQRIPDFDGYTGIYGVTVSGDLHLKEYQFKINGIGVRDPYGVMVVPGTNTNVVIDLAQTEPDGGWAARPTLVNREDAVIYEVHVRDFTIDATSGVSAEKKGKFMGMVESGTSYQGVATGIDHLKELGVTHVQIMPFYDFATGMYNWGYDPVNYNVPEEQYAMDSYDYVGRIKELKAMINEFHKAGIRVIMDVVYNHTYSNEMFENIANQYYTGNNDSGCGNAINTGVPMVSRMIQDSLEYWAREYNIDGFRFDLVGIFHYEEYGKWGDHLNNQVFPERNILMYGEPWNGYWADPEEYLKVRMGKMPAVAYGHVGVFNGKYRENIKGDNDGTGTGYMFNNLPSWRDAIAVGARGSIMAVKSTNPLPDNWDAMFAYDPEQSINYISAHDNYDLWDKILHVGIQDMEYAKRIDKFGMGIVLTSQGIPFIHGGDEMLRTKVADGDWTYAHNSYNAPDKYNSYKWNCKAENTDIFNYYKNLIQLRKVHPGLRLTTWDEINNRVDTYTWDNGAVVSYIDDDNNLSNGKELIVVFNPANNIIISEAQGWRKVFDITGVNPIDQSNIAEGTAVTVFVK